MHLNKQSTVHLQLLIAYRIAKLFLDRNFCGFCSFIPCSEKFIIKIFELEYSQFKKCIEFAKIYHDIRKAGKIFYPQIM